MYILCDIELLGLHFTRAGLFCSTQSSFAAWHFSIGRRLGGIIAKQDHHGIPGILGVTRARAIMRILRTGTGTGADIIITGTAATGAGTGLAAAAGAAVGGATGITGAMVGGRTGGGATGAMVGGRTGAVGDFVGGGGGSEKHDPRYEHQLRTMTFRCSGVNVSMQISSE
jgi:hypothetical protein